MAATKGPGDVASNTVGFGHFDRDDVLTGVVIVDGITGVWTACELVFGARSGLANALTVIGTGTAITFGAAVLNQSSDDPALWTATLAGAAILSVAAVDVMRRHLAPDAPAAGTVHAFLVPRVEPLPNEHSTRFGLALAGTF